MALLDPDRYKKRFRFISLSLSTLLIVGAFFLGLFLTNRPQFARFISPIDKQSTSKTIEVFGFAPYWNLSKLRGINWDVLTTFAYFSLDVDENGTIDRNSYEWSVLDGEKMQNILKTAKSHDVKVVVTLTQMERPVIETFLDNEDAWRNVASETVTILNEKHLDGVNIDFEYMPSNSEYREKFSKFFNTYSAIVKAQKPDSYLTVSVLASSERFNKIYDIASLAATADGVVMMAYDFYYPGSDAAGPTAPLYGYNNGKGPFWYDVSTATADFLKVADASKIILGIPYYGWNYSASSPQPMALSNARASATTNERAQDEQLIITTPIGGWDDQAKVSWRGYWDEDGWHIVYLEDKKSLTYKYDFVKVQGLKGVGLWALGYDNGDHELWTTLRETFLESKELASAEYGRSN